MVTKIIFILSFLFSGKSSFSKLGYFPFTNAVDFGTPATSVSYDFDTRGTEYVTENLGCDKQAITTYGKNAYGNKIEYVYYFYNGFHVNKNDTLSGLYLVTVSHFGNKDLTSDDNVVEVFVEEYAASFGIPIVKKHGRIQSDRRVLDFVNSPKSTILLMDGTWWIFDKNKNAVALRFPTREHIKMGHVSQIIYKKKYNIDWTFCED